MRKRYAVAGTGGRSGMYWRAAALGYPEHAELVGICDVNPGRMEVVNERLREKGHAAVPAYRDSDFDKLVAEQRPDIVVVTTRDCFHDHYIVRALELGCDAITEKPMTIDAARCQRILDAVKRTGRKVRVTFNYRYSPARTQVKDLLMSGVIGRVLSVDFHWWLDTAHGADYFRRWHRNKANSGGLLVHKATHHFDLVNWWLSSTPEEVWAMGARAFYIPQTAEKLGLSGRSERCLDCPVKADCKFCLDMTKDAGLRMWYLDQEKHDGYFRDRCVFSPEIDIEDTMGLTVRYRSGAYMSYSLNAFCPKEGYEVRFNGTRGRLEHTTLETSYVSGQEHAHIHETIRKGSSTWVFPHFGKPYQVELPQAKGGHGGGDGPLLDDLFPPNPPEDKYLRAATHVEGAWSILTGVAANRSIATGQPVRADKLVEGLGPPKFPPMPEW